MFQTVLRCIVFGLMLRTTLCQCNGYSKNVFLGTGFIKASGYPTVENKEHCTWGFYLYSPKILVLDVTDIQLYYEYGRNYILCSNELSVGSDHMHRHCQNLKPFCTAYYNDITCFAALSKIEDIFPCKLIKHPGNPISVTFISDGFGGWKDGDNKRNFPRGFELEYKFVKCHPDSTTLAITTTPSIPATKPLTSVFSSKVLNLTTNSAELVAESNQCDCGNTTLPIVIALLLILLVAGGVWVYNERKRSNRAPAQENEYQDFELRQRAENTTRAQPGSSVNNTPAYLNTGILQSELHARSSSQSQAERHSIRNQAQQRSSQSTSRNQAMNQSEGGEYSALNLIQPTPNQQDSTGEYSALNLDR